MSEIIIGPKHMCEKMKDLGVGYDDPPHYVWCEYEWYLVWDDDSIPAVEWCPFCGSKLPDRWEHER